MQDWYSISELLALKVPGLPASRRGLLDLAETGRFGSMADLDQQLSPFRNLELHRLPGNHHLHLEQQAADVAALLAQFIRCNQA